MKIARIGDKTFGVCTAHQIPIFIEGFIKIASGKCKCEGSTVAVMGDEVISNCGHTGIINSSSSVVKSNKKGIVRVGDSFIGAYSGIITTGNKKVSAK